MEISVIEHAEMMDSVWPIPFPYDIALYISKSDSASK